MRQKILEAGLHFDYSENVMVPEIPKIRDVLYMLQLCKEEEHFDFSLSNHTTYIANVALVASVVADEVLNLKPYEEEEAMKLIAETILDLCPKEARCLFVNAFVEAQEIFVGHTMPSCNVPADELREICGCTNCTKRIRQLAHHTACN